MKVYALTDVGKLRPNNEDSFYAPAKGESFCAVADGMGGHKAGEVASGIAVERFQRLMQTAQEPLEIAMREALLAANASIFETAQGREDLSGMGTTMTALCFSPGEAILAHVGDSRAYLIRNNAIVRLTNDHTLVEEMVEEGLITLQEARVHPKRNYLTRALGTGPKVEVDLIRIERREDDVFLLCSDGLSNHVPEKDMLNTIMNAATGEACVRRLVDIALNHGGSDNITALLVTDEEDSE